MADQFEVGYALLIGIHENAVPQLALPDVIKDIAVLHAALVHPQRCAYPEANVKVVTGTDATRKGIQDGLDWLYEKLQLDGSDNTTAVVYFSGHGWQDTETSPSTYYLIPYDMQQGRYRSRAFRATDFAWAITELRPKRLLVILDCCHAGGIEAKEVDLGPYSLQKSALPPELFMSGEKSVGTAKDIFSLSTGAGRAILASSQGTQKSYIRRDRKMSIFTYHLVEALTGHAQPLDGAREVLVSDLMSYVTRNVPISAKEEANAEQVPDFQVSGNFPVALLLGGKGLGKDNIAPNPLDDAPELTATDIFIQTGQRVDGTQTNISGDVSGDVYSGTIGQIGERRIDTSGGAYIGGNVIVGGDFVGRDKVVYGPSSSDLGQIFIPLLHAIERVSTPSYQDAVQIAHALKGEAEKGDNANDERMARLVDKLVTLVPEMLSTVITVIDTPILKPVIGPVTQYVVDRLRER